MEGKKKVTASVGSAEVELGGMQPKLHTARVSSADGAACWGQEEGPTALPAACSSAGCCHRAARQLQDRAVCVQRFPFYQVSF